jgi:predicted kinase
MPKITILKGLPASGKSTFAKEQITKDPNTKRVNKDDLRSMLDNSKWSRNNEKFVLKVRDFIVLESLKDGHNVIVDDTNLHDKHIERLKQIAKETNSKVEVNDSFLSVSVEECIKRDLKRANSVGEKVIKDMYENFVQEEAQIQKPEYNPNLENCILVDIDGCLAIKSPERGYYDWHKVGKDQLNHEIADLVDNYFERGTKVFILSGRDGSCKSITNDWLLDNSVRFDALYMRDAGDMRKDEIIKKEIYEEHIKDKYNVKLIVDDRMQVVRMWHSLGLPIVNVNALAKEY